MSSWRPHSCSLIWMNIHCWKRCFTLMWMRNVLAVNLRKKKIMIKKYPPLRIWPYEISQETFCTLEQLLAGACSLVTVSAQLQSLQYDNFTINCHWEAVTAELHSWATSRLDWGQINLFSFSTNFACSVCYYTYQPKDSQHMLFLQMSALLGTV